MPDSFFKRGFNKFQNLQSLDTLEQRLEGHLQSLTDEIALVLRGHLYVERLMHDVLIAYFGRTNRLFPSDRPGFSSALTLLRVINIADQKVTEAAGYLNDLRNSMAHTVTTLTGEIDDLKGGRSTFKNSCNAMKVPGINQSNDRQLFIHWVSKTYVELTKCKYMAIEIRSAMMKPDFINLFDSIDVGQALTDPINSF